MIKQGFKLVMSLAAALLCACGATKPLPAAPQQHENLIIYYDAASGNKALLKAAGMYGSEVLYVYKIINGIAVTVPAGKSVTDAIKFYEKVPGVLTVSRDQKLQLD